MGLQKKRFTLEFKREALALAESSESIAAVARDLDIPANTLYKWRSQLNHKPSEDQKQRVRKSYRDEEIRRLERENKKLRLERDFLKKAAAFFAKEGSNGTSA